MREVALSRSISAIDDSCKATWFARISRMARTGNGMRCSERCAHVIIPTSSPSLTSENESVETWPMLRMNCRW